AARQVNHAVTEATLLSDDVVDADGAPIRLPSGLPIPRCACFRDVAQMPTHQFLLRTLGSRAITRRIMRPAPTPVTRMDISLRPKGIRTPRPQTLAGGRAAGGCAIRAVMGSHAETHLSSS